jgi:hypothetical protein
MRIYLIFINTFEILNRSNLEMQLSAMTPVDWRAWRDLQQIVYDVVG